MLSFIFKLFGIFSTPQRNSETWVLLGTLLGQLGAQNGWFSAADWDKVLWPALVYVIARLTSKVAKAVPQILAEAAVAAKNAK